MNDQMNCKHCNAVVESCRMETEANKFVVCPDGYDANWAPRSGRKETIHQQGHSHFYALPCEHPISEEEAEQLTKTECVWARS